MAAPIARFPAGATAHPAFDALRPWLQKLRDDADLDDLNALACAGPIRPATGSGQPVRFCTPASAGRKHYEQRIFDTGEVDTRPGNLHDLFNALAWLAFPRTKAAINARHVARLRFEGAARGPMRDLMTLVDEGGVIVACAEGTAADFESLVRGFRWQELFWARRRDLLRDTRFVLLGHSAFEKALAPYPGITCKALFLPVTRVHLEQSGVEMTRALDALAAGWVRTLPDSANPRLMPPLPVFGYPGWIPGSDEAGFYADRRWFRAAPATVRDAPKGLSM